MTGRPPADTRPAAARAALAAALAALAAAAAALALAWSSWQARPEGPPRAPAKFELCAGGGYWGQGDRTPFAVFVTPQGGVDAEPLPGTCSGSW